MVIGCPSRLHPPLPVGNGLAFDTGVLADALPHLRQLVSVLEDLERSRQRAVRERGWSWQTTVGQRGCNVGGCMPRPRTFGRRAP